MGLHGISIKRTNNFELEKLGVISMDVQCQTGTELREDKRGASKEATSVLVGALLVVAGLIMFVLCSYCCFKKKQAKTSPLEELSPVVAKDKEEDLEEPQIDKRNTGRILFDKLTMDSGRDIGEIDIYSQ
jgi:hypothetical protein